MLDTEIRQRLIEAADLARRSIEPGLEPADARSAPDFAGACLHTSVVLQQLLQRFFGLESVVRGGAGGESRSGAVDRCGQWHGHFWVEVGSTGPGESGWVVDPTGDQFGHAPVRVMRIHEAAGFLRPVDQATVDAQVQALLASVAQLDHF